MLRLGFHDIGKLIKSLPIWLNSVSLEVIVLVKLSVAVLKHCDQKQLGAKKISAYTYFPHHSPLLKKVRVETHSKNLEEETDAEAMKERCFLTCF